MQTPTKSQIVSAGLAKCVSDALKDLLENHHLYQSVTVDMARFDKMAEVIRQKPRSQISPMTGDEVAVLNRLKQVRNDWWALSLEGVLPTILVPPLRVTTPTPNWFHPPTVCVKCENCNAIKPAHNPGYLGLTSDSLYTYTSRQTSVQVFALPYQCQNCKSEPMFFLVRRESLKLTLVGRSQFPEVTIPNFIPKEQQKFYRNAIIADQTNFTLAATLYLRAVVEQYFYAVIPQEKIKGIRGKPTGDELADLYAETLPKNFPNNFPSLKKLTMI